MFTQDELGRFAQWIDGTRTLTVYAGAPRPVTEGRATWGAAVPPAVNQAVARTRAGLASAPQLERAAFEACVLRLDAQLAGLSELTWPGWVGFFPQAGDDHAEPLPVPMPLSVRWGLGPRIAPYVRALKQHRPALVVVADGQVTTLYVYVRGLLELVDRFDGASPDELRRAIEAAAGPDGWVLLGGDAAHLVSLESLVPKPLQDRSRRLRGVDGTTARGEIARAAERAAMAESRERDLELVLDLIDQRGAAPSGGVGVAGVREALLRKTVGTLCVTASFIEEHELDAEALVRLALRNGAEVEVVSAAAAARLNEVGGVGVLLRPPEGARTPAARPGVARPAGSSLSDSTLSI